jgi:hypothetical protein
MQLDIHALQRLLHQLHAVACRSHMVGTQAQVVLQPTNVGRWHEAGPQQAVHMQRGTPLAVGHIGLPAWEVARLPSIDHAHFQFCPFQHAVQGKPVDTSRLHGN